MSAAAPADLQRWSEEVARDPDSLAFLPLADAYRRQGKREAALKVCLRGLSRHPQNVEAHSLLARIYLETGDRQKAADSWAVVLRLEPENFEAHRGMGFFHLELGDYEAARGHLEQASAERPKDPTVREAIALLRAREGEVDEEPEPDVADEAAPATTASPSEPRDPGRVFESLRSETPFRGAVLFDRKGLVLAQTLASGEDGRAEALGAILGDVIEEAVRTTEHLDLGGWEGLLMETEDTTVHITPLHDPYLVLFAATSDAPTGWVLRAAGRAAELAGEFLEQSP